jgi:hypothetical protein
MARQHLFGEAIQTGDFQRAGSEEPAVGLTRSLRMSRIAAAGHVYVIETRRSLRTPQPTPFTTCRVDAWSLGYQEGSAQGQGVVRGLTHPLTSASHHPTCPLGSGEVGKAPFNGHCCSNLKRA